jgi:hypothetical protein
VACRTLAHHIGLLEAVEVAYHSPWEVVGEAFRTALGVVVVVWEVEAVEPSLVAAAVAAAFGSEPRRRREEHCSCRPRTDQTDLT